MKLVFFEDPSWRELWPLSTVKPVFLLEVGGRRLYEYWVDALNPEGVAFFLRPEVAGLYDWLLNIREERGVEVNPDALDDDVLAVSHVVPPLPKALELASKALGWPGNVLVHKGGRVLMVKVSVSFADTLVEILKGEPSPELFLNLLEATTDIPFPDAPEFLRLEDVLRYSIELLSRSENRLEGGIEDGVAIDTNAGPVVIEKGAIVESGSRLVGPVYVGPGVRVRAGTRLEACSLAGYAIVGGCFENCIMGPYVQAPDARLTNVVSPGYVELAPLTVSWGGVAGIGYVSSTSPLTSLEGACRIGRGSEVAGRFTGDLPPLRRYRDGDIEDVDPTHAKARLRRLLSKFNLLPSDYELSFLD